jgi:hypothetical protein
VDLYARARDLRRRNIRKVIPDLLSLTKSAEQAEVVWLKYRAFLSEMRVEPPHRLPTI